VLDGGFLTRSESLLLTSIMNSIPPDAWLKNRSTHSSVPHSEAEICVNVWHFVDETGMVMMLAAKAYALKGTDDEKLAVLKSLSATDYLTAIQARVPDQYVLSTVDGDLKGVLPASALQMDPVPVFDQLFQKLSDSLPSLLVSVEGDYQKLKLQLVEPFLWVSTAVYESPDGQLIARIS
jgi:hypothetical protein